jgi:glutathione synthase/RimK-type ligase-like ATP-grasp enzyme
LRAVAAALASVGAEPVWVDGGLRILRPFSDRSGAVLQAEDRKIPLDDVRAAYLRPSAIPMHSNEERRAFDVLLAWADHADGKIVNRPTPSLLNHSKPLQSQWIRRLGLRTPETFISTDPAAVRAFAERHGDVVYKSISGVRSIVGRLTENRRSDLDDVAHCPTQFQEYIPGHDLRIHVFGDVVHALRIRGTCDDYRYPADHDAPLEVEQADVAPCWTAQLRSVVRQMGLVVAGIDFRVTPSGEMYCLEINPSPAFTYYEQLAGVSLAKYIAALLVE